MHRDFWGMEEKGSAFPGESEASGRDPVEAGHFPRRGASTGPGAEASGVWQTGRWSSEER